MRIVDIVVCDIYNVQSLLQTSLSIEKCEMVGLSMTSVSIECVWLWTLILVANNRSWRGWKIVPTNKTIFLTNAWRYLELSSFPWHYSHHAPPVIKFEGWRYSHHSPQVIKFEGWRCFCHSLLVIKFEGWVLISNGCAPAY